MNALLKDLVCQSLQYRTNNDKFFELNDRILDLQLTDSDFDNDFFESFDPKERFEMYTMVVRWVDVPYGLKILKDRLIFETDWECVKRLQSMLRHLRSQGFI
jgi:hypothetical protein